MERQQRVVPHHLQGAARSGVDIYCQNVQGVSQLLGATCKDGIELAAVSAARVSCKPPFGCAFEPGRQATVGRGRPTASDSRASSCVSLLDCEK